MSRRHPTLHPDKPLCACGKGKVSSWDGKCGHCRTDKEQKEYVWRHRHGRIERQYPELLEGW